MGCGRIEKKMKRLLFSFSPINNPYFLILSLHFYSVNFYCTVWKCLIFPTIPLKCRIPIRIPIGCLSDQLRNTHSYSIHALDLCVRGHNLPPSSFGCPNVFHIYFFPGAISLHFLCHFPSELKSSVSAQACGSGLTVQKWNKGVSTCRF